MGQPLQGERRGSHPHRREGEEVRAQGARRGEAPSPIRQALSPVPSRERRRRAPSPIGRTEGGGRLTGGGGTLTHSGRRGDGERADTWVRPYHGHPLGSRLRGNDGEGVRRKRERRRFVAGGAFCLGSRLVVRGGWPFTLTPSTFDELREPSSGQAPPSPVEGRGGGGRRGLFVCG